MKLNIYTIFDNASGAYMRPFFLHSDGQAVRSFKDIASDAEHEVGKHPEDYSLHRIGVYDDSKAALIPEDRECLVTALEVLAQTKRVDGEQLDAFNQNLGEQGHA